MWTINFEETVDCASVEALQCRLTAVAFDKPAARSLFEAEQRLRRKA
jgi:hypothetical protein